MNKTLKLTLIAAALTGVFSSSAFAAKIESKALQGSVIKGYIPYMESIASRIVVGGTKDENGDWTGLEVGDVIDIPAHLTAEQLSALGIPNAFKLGDQDGDSPAARGKKFSIHGQQYDGKTEFQVTWYAIEPKDGKTWQQVQSWDDVNPTQLNGAYYEDNSVSKSLIVPPEAAGKRLGFIAIPTTETGVPNKGLAVKAWDLSKIWNQQPPTKPGDCTEGDPECGDNGTPGENNPGGGGGNVGAPDGIINIFNSDKKIVRPGDDLFVTSTYYATIRIKDGDTYREPNATELGSLKWNIVDSETGEIKATYDKASGRVSITPEAEKTATGLNLYKFTTQNTNDDADALLKALGPNYSEQGWSLAVEIESSK